MPRQTQHYVTLKGTKEGLRLRFDDECSYSMLIDELKRRLEEQKDQLSSPSREKLQVIVDTGRRFLTDQQKQEIESLHESYHIQVARFQSEVISIEEAEAKQKASKVTRLAKVIRSGQVQEMDGDVLLIGDVNPGAVLKATGSIFILGSLKGTAHAGVEGNIRAVISASFMDPAQLRIAHIVREPPEEEEWRGMFECALVDDTGELILDRAQNLGSRRPELMDEDR
ncbi:septum site-determining protein MinC [Alkalicoccus urumqiensis]|uniref:Probable septum site-determining protein MinC n=1 Tax=Alkalicoccus urumqiensis TaxID=1548213 RepID=A0A2P6MF10_ALKUR|nr:septum site-determining protein MinC [Alkalicoccus urumqiensis]PRO64892.1 septum site-determining protein MinC [Alkalicoccus urumqiensis]